MKAIIKQTAICFDLLADAVDGINKVFAKQVKFYYWNLKLNWKNIFF